MFLIKRTDQGGGYVSKQGSSKAYTMNVKRMRKFPTREAADADRCPENEVVVPIAEVLD